jgi:hypothetical protein
LVRICLLRTIIFVVQYAYMHQVYNN